MAVRLFDRFNKVKLRGGMLEPYRRLLETANDLTNKAISEFKSSSSTGAVLTDGVESLIKDMVKAQQAVIWEGLSIKDAVRALSSESSGVCHQYELDSEDEDSEDEFVRPQRRKDLKNEVVGPQVQHDLISQVDKWKELISRIQEIDFPEKLTGTLPIEDVLTFISSINRSNLTRKG